MKSALGRSRTALALLRYCIRGRMWWAAPALGMLLIAGVLGLFGGNSNPLTPD